MNSPKYGRRFRTKYQENTRTPTQKLLMFDLGNERYGLPIEQVQRVLKQFTPQGILESGRSLLREQNETITIVDVSLLFVTSRDDRQRDYLIVCSASQGQKLGIPIPDMPKILDVPLDNFTDIPAIYRQGQLSPGVEKLIHLADQSLIFYLNLDLLVNSLIRENFS